MYCNVYITRVRLLWPAVAIVLAIASQVCEALQPLRELAVCADPNDLPMSSRKLQGFENRIAALIAADLHTNLRYVWYPQRRGFLRKTLKAGLCDVVMSVPAEIQGLSVTRPYYTSSYAFVSVRRRHLDLTTFDDPALGGLKIGLQTIGAEGSNPPAASSLGLRGLSANVIGFPVWGDGSDPAPQQRIIAAVAEGTIDAAIVWGPFAGYFAKRYANHLAVSPIVRDPQMPELTFTYDIAVGVRSGEDDLRDELQDVLDRRRSEIEHILNAYGILVTATSASAPLRLEADSNRANGSEFHSR